MIDQQQVKSLTTEDFEGIFKGYLTDFKTTPRLHQFASALWGFERNKVMFLLGIGTGKTYAALLTDALWNADDLHYASTLIVCPNSVKEVWKNEIRKHMIDDYKYVVLEGSTAERKKLLYNTQVKYYIINYEGLKLLFSEREQKRRGGTKHVPSSKLIQSKQFGCIIIDESHRAKEFKSIQSQILYKLSQTTQKTIMLTGTPYGSDMSDFWSEFMVLDQGDTLGQSWGLFMNEYFNRYQITVHGHNIDQWSIKKDAREEILEKIGPRVIRYSTEECIDLPPVTYSIRYVNFSEKQKELYTKILADMKIELEEGKIKINNIVNKSLKLLQLSSGFLIKGDQVSYLKSNPKLKDLMDILSEVEDKAIVFHHFVAEGHMIEKKLKSKGIKFASMRGEIKDKPAEYKKFVEDPTVRVLIAHPLTGGEGLNLQVANVIIFFSQIGGGAITRTQTEGRIVRAGQERPCVIIDLLARNVLSKEESIDEKIHKASKDKKEVAENLLRWLSKC